MEMEKCCHHGDRTNCTFRIHQGKKIITCSSVVLLVGIQSRCDYKKTLIMITTIFTVNDYLCIEFLYLTKISCSLLMIEVTGVLNLIYKRLVWVQVFIPTRQQPHMIDWNESLHSQWLFVYKVEHLCGKCSLCFMIIA